MSAHEKADCPFDSKDCTVSTGYWRVKCHVCGLTFEEWMVQNVNRLRNQIKRLELLDRPRPGLPDLPTLCRREPS